jgi:hypothetical protein
MKVHEGKQENFILILTCLLRHFLQELSHGSVRFRHVTCDVHNADIRLSYVTDVNASIEMKIQIS